MELDPELRMMAAKKKRTAGRRPAKRRAGCLV
jgi:hypothetical protein